ncbi:hypothetical protein [Pseudosulfitobacter pseudonitzschiae]|uniref:hypothetical protein n=1 Tax=Pseudosulfitobacter pseudonitzschiae TaxID=1402135 RepID=UPI001AFA7299|nr:hypothetical protein [Pseudosulfitobacter pseudonitzschiae]MBM1814541.1 hypothetical protein [Pseudosulfitobacter pseudonitzschiae]MBM1831535.1 hypothetical protein [Pseudosulfitobacter pseudonitzschiae]MBM1836401.1 hypothetical protein [Pseudosulfitobacter pseudonitzschiae]MBM1841247.1 hypothetical protein [Pseudosulfitobacter pseudonitzschiae]MBM1846115.1 hypothetical protein [Pseudosulfitobacter pseudonitzschiae]
MIIADLIEDHNLVIYCKNIRCSRSVHLTRAEAVERFGAGYSLAAIRDRGRCASCRSVGAVTIVQYVGKTGAI